MLSNEEIQEVERIFEIEDPYQRLKQMGEFMQLGALGRTVLFEGRKRKQREAVPPETASRCLTG